MKRHILFAVVLVLALGAIGSARADVVRYDRSVDYGAYLKFDRYLSVEIWTDHDEYYEGDNIEFSFKANEDCFVVVYNIDSRGDVHLLYPAGPQDDYRIQGGRIYNVPSSNDDYELTVRGPEGVEYLQIIASREPFPLNDWVDDLYCDGDPYDFMDYINANFFGCQSNCHRAYDMTSFIVQEWDEYYFRPVYYYDRPHWSYAGSIFIDYPFGASIYVDGIYWGCAPLFIPRIYYGWHWVTVYDHYGYCWEDQIQVVRRKSVVLNETVVRTKVNVDSRYREVRTSAYRDPVKSGYKDYDTQVVKKREIYETRKNSPQGGGTTRMQSEGRSGSQYNGRTTSSTRSGSSDETRRSSESDGTYERGSRSTRSGGSSDMRRDDSESNSRRSAGELKSSRRGSSSRSTESSSERKTSTSSRSPRSTPDDRSSRTTRKSEPAKDQPSSSPSVKSSGQDRQPSSGSTGSSSSGSGSSGNKSETRRSR